MAHKVDSLRAGQVLFRVHAQAVDGEVDAGVFAAKLTTLIKALKAADRAVNKGLSAHQYTIAKLHTSSPTAILNERLALAVPYPLLSGISAFDSCADTLALGERPDLEIFGGTVQKIKSLATGASNSFGYAEIWTDNDSVVRVDPFLRERADAAIAFERELAAPVKARWFKGNVFASFDGTLKAVDLRGAVPQIKLTLKAGGKDIDCICRAEHFEEIKEALNRRVRVSGRAIYDGKSGLPRRVEVARIDLTREAGDVSRWRGSFEPFDTPDWPGDND
ncbi:hypothetical protein NKI48_16465 [Mesorhizobium sp. M0644]|uniref:hypothetical protein n=1 Tax=unclassified Mesorhizobium TaxID=325217 RepID=UPI0033373C6A